MSKTVELSSQSKSAVMSYPASDRVKFASFVVDLHTHEVRKDGTRVKLIGQPFEILAVLLSRPGELVTREELRMRLWPGDTFVDFDHGLNAAVNKLRETLCDSAESPRFVETLPRRGYRFIARVEKLDGLEKLTAVPVAEKALTEATAIAGTAVAPRNRWRAFQPLLSPLAGAVALLLILVAVTLRGKNGASREARAESAAGAPHLVPFTGADEDAGLPAFSPDGSRIAFARAGRRDGDSGIFVKPVNGGSQSQLTKNEDDRFPAWSPDGATIVFAREERTVSLFTMPSGGGSERRLDTGNVEPKRGELDWSPDGKWIAFNGGDALFRVAPEGGQARRLTNPPPSAEDRAPSFSADSKRLLFVRSRGGGFPEEIRTIAVEGGEETLLTSITARVLGIPRWAADEKSVIFSSNFGGKSGLWRISTVNKDSPIQINDSAVNPALSGKRDLLAYERGSHGLNIWELDISPDAPRKDASGKTERRQKILVPLTGQTDQGPGPQFSPNGGKLAFMSDRSGTMEIWISDADGSNAKQLTSIGNAGTPRWSPDGKAIAFDATRKNGASIFTVSVENGETRLVTADDFENRCPSWSRDGKWIYYATPHTGKFEVWKIPAAGGTAVRLTQQGGHAAMEAPDGKHIFYAKTAMAYPEIWQADVNGGGEKILSREVRPAMWAAWTVVDAGPRGGILFAQPSGSGAPVLSLYDLATRRVKNVGQVGIIPFWLGATRDGKRVVFDQPGWQQSQIMLMENFR